MTSTASTDADLQRSYVVRPLPYLLQKVLPVVRSFSSIDIPHFTKHCCQGQTVVRSVTETNLGALELFPSISCTCHDASHAWFHYRIWCTLREYYYPCCDKCHVAELDHGKSAILGATRRSNVHGNYVSSTLPSASQVHNSAALPDAAAPEASIDVNTMAQPDSVIEKTIQDGSDDKSSKEMATNDCQAVVDGGEGDVSKPGQDCDEPIAAADNDKKHVNNNIIDLKVISSQPLKSDQQVANSTLPHVSSPSSASKSSSVVSRRNHSPQVDIIKENKIRRSTRLKGKP